MYSKFTIQKHFVRNSLRDPYLMYLGHINVQNKSYLNLLSVL